MLFSSLLLGFALLLAGAPSLHAQSSPFLGTYVLNADASDTMEQIVDRGMERLGRIYRVWPISNQAKARLRETNRPYAWIQIVPGGSEVTVQTDAYKLTSPANGTLQDWERSEGDFIDVTTRLQGRTLEQAFQAADGRRVNRFTLSPDGRTLTMHVTVTSEKLDSPLEYQQVFTRR